MYKQQCLYYTSARQRRHHAYLINDWTLTGKALGVNIFEDGSIIYILGVDNVNNYIQAYDEAGGTLGTMPLSTANAACFGVAWNYDATNDTR